MSRNKMCAVFFVTSVIFVITARLSTISAQQSGLGPGEDAQTNPKNRDVQMSLTVGDDELPTSPILVSPSNTSTINDSTPSFVWEESTDNLGMSHYKFTLDGVVKFDSIPLTDTSNSDYVLTKSGTRYTLTPIVGLAEGSHTWKITAVDINTNSKDSDTWSFTIDTTAPPLVITQIGEASTSISAQDSSTLPNPYLTIYTNEPTLVGNSEANSTIQLKVDIPGESSLNYSISVDSSGHWSKTLPILPRDVQLTFTFVVTDSAGNTTNLNNVYVMIATEYFFATPVPTATPIPSGTPAMIISQPPSGTEEPPSPIIQIPVLTPKEITENILKAIIPEVLINQVPEIVKEVGEISSPIGSAIVSVALPVTTTALVASQFGWGISFQILLRILQALGILPPPNPQGIVFNSETEEPVPFAILNISKIGDLSTAETVITNTDGVYGGIQLPPGKYAIEVRHQDFAFPSQKMKPSYLSMFEFYKGEIFEVTKESSKQLFLIPVDSKNSVVKATGHSLSWSLIRQRLIRLSSLMIFPLFILSLIIAIYYPTLVNMGVCVVYLISMCYRALKWFKKPLIRGKVVDDNGQPLENVFVRIFLQESNQLMSLLVTDKNGNFKAFLPKGEYQVSLIKQNHVWVDHGEVQNFYLADARKKKSVILAVMENSANLYKDLF